MTANQPLMALLKHLAEFERLPCKEQSAILTRKLSKLIIHAANHSSFWKERLQTVRAGAPFHDIPPLTRKDIQDGGDRLRALSSAMKEEELRRVATSGSTGRPVATLHYKPLYQPLYRALGMREMAWHSRDQSRDILAIKDDQADGVYPGWGVKGAPLDLVGTMKIRNLINYSPEEHLLWLKSQTAPYLTTTPSMALRLSELALADGGSQKKLEQVITYSEVVTSECREKVKEAFGARVIDRYSCEEAGWLAFQCPKHDHYHAVSSSAIVEIVDGHDRQVNPGETGRVLITALYSYAMPLIRYETGDCAVAGEPCDCGITLPVIKEILGRERSFIRLSDGTTRMARLTGDYWREIAPIEEYRVVQYSDDFVEAFVTCKRVLAKEELEAMRVMLLKVIHPELFVMVTQVDNIDWQGRKRIDVMRLDRMRGML